MMRSPTYGEVTIDEIVQIIKNKVVKNPTKYNLMIGTDSQNHDKTKVVSVIALHEIGHGGIFFYDTHYTRRINDINRKMLYEATCSLNLANDLIYRLEELIEEDFVYSDYIHLEIHVDIGENGNSNQTIPEIVGWIKSCGYDVTIKPDSYAATSIANKYSK